MKFLKLSILAFPLALIVASCGIGAGNNEATDSATTLPAADGTLAPAAILPVNEQSVRTDTINAAPAKPAKEATAPLQMR